MQSLDELKIGESGCVSKFDLNPTDHQRILEMGITVGAKVKIVKVAPLGDPIEILVRGYHLSLRKSEARLIWVDGP